VDDDEDELESVFRISCDVTVHTPIHIFALALVKTKKKKKKIF
jgi:hypothetical protein